jgi:hypothetical protein
MSPGFFWFMQGNAIPVGAGLLAIGTLRLTCPNASSLMTIASKPAPTDRKS